MGNITSGTVFKGVVEYNMQKPGAELLASGGVRTDNEDAITSSFILQSQMRPGISKPVKHISLNFHPEDKPKLTDEKMVRIAREYMDKMGYGNTQYIIVKHTDKPHPHVHLVMNRIGYDGNVIKDSFEKRHNERICELLTKRYGLHISEGKERVNRESLREPDKTRYEIYDALKDAAGHCRNWNELKAGLSRSGIGVGFKYRSGLEQLPENIQGVTFAKNGYTFSGSKIDRRFSYSKLDAALNENARRQDEPLRVQAGTPPVSQDRSDGGGQVRDSDPEQIRYQWPDNDSYDGGYEQDYGSYGSILSDLLNPGGNPDYDDWEIEEARRLRRRKKKQGISM